MAEKKPSAICGVQLGKYSSNTLCGKLVAAFAKIGALAFGTRYPKSSATSTSKIPKTGQVPSVARQPSIMRLTLALTTFPHEISQRGNGPGRCPVADKVELTTGVFWADEKQAHAE